MKKMMRLKTQHREEQLILRAVLLFYRAEISLTFDYQIIQNKTL
ncbi:MAG: hypothetical protein JWQ79_1192 [Mucilaginibacter sp.]|nr:hypothetical protein [Mucilaginibacter sp.]